MRPLELALIAVQLPAAGVFAVSGSVPAWFKCVFFAPVLLAIAEIVFEGYRWHMLPAYVGSGWVLLPILQSRLSSSTYSRTGIFVLAGLATGAFLLAVIFPVFKLPNPTGPFAVGSRIVTLADYTRRETAPEALSGPRELVAEIWYPAEQANISGRTAFYRSRQLANGLMSQLRFVRTHTVPGAPIRSGDERFPVVIFSPSWGGDRRQNTFLVEELASHGYLVVSLDHPYGTGGTLFPDGRIVKNRNRGWLEFGSREAYERSRSRVEQELETRVADIQFVLHQLSHPSGPLRALAARADVDRAGVIGHSFGGTVAAEVCHRDGRFRCAVNMDGLMMGQSAELGVRQPLLTMSDDTVLPSREAIQKMGDSQQLYYNILLGDVAHIQFTIDMQRGYMFRLRGGSHMNFSDAPLYSRLRRFTGGGRIRAGRAFTIVRACALAFFDEHLKDIRRPLLDDASAEFSEVADYQCRKAREWTDPLSDLA